MRTRLLVLLLSPLLLAPLLLVSACGRGAGGGPGRAAVSAAALNAGGEPQWSALLRGGVLRFSAGDAPVLAVTAQRVDHGAAGVVWSGVLAGKAGQSGEAVTLTTQARPCQDATTGLGYPLSAVVQVGGRRYAGCAAPAGQGLGPRT